MSTKRAQFNCIVLTFDLYFKKNHTHIVAHMLFKNVGGYLQRFKRSFYTRYMQQAGRSSCELILSLWTDGISVWSLLSCHMISLQLRVNVSTRPSVLEDNTVCLLSVKTNKKVGRTTTGFVVGELLNFFIHYHKYFYFTDVGLTCSCLLIEHCFK